MKKLTIAVTTLLLCANITLAAQEQKTIQIAAGSTATDLIVTPAQVPFEKASGIHLRSYKTAGKAAVAALGKGEVQAAMTDLSLEDIMAEVKKGTIIFPDVSRLKAFPILQTRSVVVVHKDNPLTSFSKDQLKAIFSGKGTKWQEFGGKDQLILVAISIQDKGTIAEFSRKIMDNEPLLNDAIHVNYDQEVKNFIAATPEAIGVLPSMAMVDAALKAPATPDISKTVNFYSLGEPVGDAKTLLDFLKGPGQALFIK